MDIGLFCGVFDPIHLGHLHIINAVKNKIDLNEIWVLPNYIPPHKSSPQASFQDRYTMIQMAITDIFLAYEKPYIRCVTLEEIIQPYPNYTINTIKYIKDLTQAELFLIMGSDEWNNFPTWYKVDQICQLCQIVVVKRYHTELIDHENFSYIFADYMTENISSSGIRKQLQAASLGEIPCGLTQSVWKFIQENKLYKKGKENKL